MHLFLARLLIGFVSATQLKEVVACAMIDALQEHLVTSQTGDESCATQLLCGVKLLTQAV